MSVPLTSSSAPVLSFSDISPVAPRTPPRSTSTSISCMISWSCTFTSCRSICLPRAEVGHEAQGGDKAFLNFDRMNAIKCSPRSLRDRTSTHPDLILRRCMILIGSTISCRTFQRDSGRPPGRFGRYNPWNKPAHLSQPPDYNRPTAPEDCNFNLF